MSNLAEVLWGIVVVAITAFIVGAALYGVAFCLAAGWAAGS